MKNFQIFLTDNNTYVLRADSKRFGKNVIVFESYNRKDVVRYMFQNYRNSKGEIITNSGRKDSLYAKAMMTCKPTDTNPNPWYRG